MKPDAEDVAQYLKEHPRFFEDYADMLADIYVSHPHGGRAIPISERQIVTLRDKNRTLQNKMREFIQFGEENDAIGEKMHRLSVALLSFLHLDELIYTLNFNLREDFSVPHVALRLWNVTEESSRVAPDQNPVSTDIRAVADSLLVPYCGPHVADEIRQWFGDDAPRLRSFTMIALQDQVSLGLLVMGSEDSRRFYPEMGTLYLKRMGELVSAAIRRCSQDTERTGSQE